MSRPSKRPQVKGYGTLDNRDSDSDGLEGKSVDRTICNENSALDPQYEPSYHPARPMSLTEEDEDPLQIDILTREEKEDTPITWTSLPHKKQLALLVVS
jgi:hypothetical protein